MSSESTKKQERFWKLYEKLPQELKDALFSEKTGNNIYEICKKYEIVDDMDEIVDYVGQVLIGLMLPADFSKTLQENLGIKENIAKQVAHEINRFIFYPVKPALEQMHGASAIKEDKSLMTSVEKAKAEKEETTPATSVASKEEITKPIGGDTYREPID